MSQLDFQMIIRQQQEQLAAMQAQIQALLTEGAVEREGPLRWQNHKSLMACCQRFQNSSRYASYILE